MTPSAADLEETYLPAFRAAVAEGHAQSVMCAYNAIDGVPVCADRELLEGKLRNDWRFGGYVTSDCGAISDFFSPGGHRFKPDRERAAVAALLAGTDTSCGDEYESLALAVKHGLVREEAIDVSVKRLFKARFQLGLFDPPEKNSYSRIPFAENDSDSNQELALETARKSVVLLKNENGVLPLRGSVARIAVLGPNAASLAALEGNYNGVPSRPVLPIDGVIKEFQKRASVIYAQGATYAKGISLPVPRTVFHPSLRDVRFGLKAEYFADSKLSGKPALTRLDQEIDFDWNAASPAAGIPAGDFSVRWTGTVTVPSEGDYVFDIGFARCWPCYDRESYSVYLDGQQVTSLTTDETIPYHAANNPAFRFRFKELKPHSIRIDYGHHSRLFGAGLTLNWKPSKGSLLREAIAAARSADVVIAFVGLSPALEGEEMPVHVEGFAGGDRTAIDLPADQEELLEALSATGKPTVVVLLNGSALAVNWAQQHAAAILEAWYPGEAGGQAIAEILSGRSNPGGRLPVTFYSSLDQLPAFSDYSMKSRTYRFFEGDPLYRFGFGLSYTKFMYSALQVPRQPQSAGETVMIGAIVRNSGKVNGDEVVQLYITPPEKPNAPLYSLQAFARLSLKPGESRRVQFALSPRQLSEVAPDGSRSVQPGIYKISVGGGATSCRIQRTHWDTCRVG